MPEELSVGESASKKQKTSGPLIAMGVLLVASLGATGWLWQRSTAEREASGTSAIHSVVHLESFVVNLSGASENGYLRVGVDLGVSTDTRDSSKQSAATGRLRDAILSVLTTQSIDDLLTPEGKAKLKQDMLAAINNRVPELQCREIYFTEFLVQR